MHRVALLILLSGFCYAQMLKTIVNDPPATGGGGGSMVNATPVQTKAGANNVTQFDNPVTVGNCVLVSVYYDTNPVTVASMADGLGNTFAFVDSALDAVNIGVEVWETKVTTGGTMQVTATMTGIGTPRMVLVEYTGCAAMGYIGNHTHSNGVNSVGPVTSTLDNSLIFISASHGNAFMACTGFALVLVSNGNANNDTQSMVGTPAGMFSGANCSFQAFLTAMVELVLQ